MTTNQIAVLCQGIQTLQDKYAPVLPDHISPAKFERAALTAVQNTPGIDKATKSSVFNACMKAAQDGLILDGREAAMTIFRGRDAVVAQYMPMVYGLMKKARQSGEIAAIHEPQIVYEHDELVLEYGDNPTLIHKPNLSAHRGNPIGAYSVIHLKDGSIQRTFMTLDQINKRRDISKAQNGPWKTWWDEMAKKTVLRANLKYCPQSTDLETVLDRDNEMFDVTPDDEQPKKKGDKRRPKALEDVAPDTEPEDVNPETGEITETGEVVEGEIEDAGEPEGDEELF